MYADGVVITTAGALGRGDGLRVRRDDGTAFDAELARFSKVIDAAGVRTTEPALAADSLELPHGVALSSIGAFQQGFGELDFSG